MFGQVFKKMAIFYQDPQRNAFWLVLCNKKPPKSIPLGVLVEAQKIFPDLLSTLLAPPRNRFCKRRPTVGWPRPYPFDEDSHQGVFGCDVFQGSVLDFLGWEEGQSSWVEL